MTAGGGGGLGPGRAAPRSPRSPSRARRRKYPRRARPRSVGRVARSGAAGLGERVPSAAESLPPSDRGREAASRRREPRLAQPDCRREARRAASDDAHVKVEGLAFLLGLLRRQASETPRLRVLPPRPCCELPEHGREAHGARHFAQEGAPSARKERRVRQQRAARPPSMACRACALEAVGASRRTAAAALPAETRGRPGVETPCNCLKCIHQPRERLIEGYDACCLLYLVTLGASDPTASQEAREKTLLSHVDVEPSLRPGQLRHPAARQDVLERGFAACAAARPEAADKDGAAAFVSGHPAGRAGEPQPVSTGCAIRRIDVRTLDTARAARHAAEGLAVA